MTARPNGSVLIEILAREDCPNRGMALIVVERVVDETGIPAEIEVVDVESDSDAEEYRVLGSPTVLVDGRDVDPGAQSTAGYSVRRPHLPHRARALRVAGAGVDPRRAATRGRADDLERPSLRRATVSRLQSRTARGSYLARSSTTSPYSTPSTHSSLRQYALRRTPSRMKPGALRMAHRALVEAVDLHLEAMEAELVEEVPLEEPRGRVGDLRAAEVRDARRDRRDSRCGCGGSPRSKRIVPARSPSTSMTKTPNASGSASERSISARISSRPFARTAARNGSTSSCVTSSTRKSASSARARRIDDAHAGRLLRTHAEEALSGRERGARDDQREPGEHRGRDGSSSRSAP